MAAVDVKRTRRGSYEFEDITADPSSTPSTSKLSPTRTRVQSNPGPGILLRAAPASAGPYRTSFNPVGPVAGQAVGSSGHTRSGSSSTSPGFNGIRNGISGPGARPGPSGSPLGPYGAHARAPSLSSDIAASPFRSSFNHTAPLGEMVPPSPTRTSHSFTPAPTGNANAQDAASRRHARIHSRNLSIFFPRPGATSVPSIAEDGAQEIEAPAEETIPSVQVGTPATRSSSSYTPHSATFITPPPPPPRSQLGGGFRFGGRPPQSPSSSIGSTPMEESAAAASTSTSGSDTGTGHAGISSVPMSTTNTNATSATSRRGHHHRHSLSHSFFSFMEPPALSSPGQQQHRRQPSSAALNVNVTSPSLTTLTVSGNGPSTAWGPISPFPASATSGAFPPAQLLPPKRTVSLTPALPNPSTQRSASALDKVLALPLHLRHGLMFAAVEGTVGCALWVLAQHSESLACAGLAYWVCFDALGVGLGVYGRLVDTGAGGGSLRLPYGAKRTETVALFAQAVYLLFSAVYICKETLEHALLSKGDAGHHHHHSPGQEGIQAQGLHYPSTLLWLSFIALSLSSTLLKSNIKILDASGIYIPSIRQTLRLFSFSPSPSPVPSSGPLRPSSTLLLSNPYTLFPLLCALLLLSLSTLPITQDSQRTADMLVAGIEAFGTFYLAWPVCQTLGKVLLQTAPERLAPSNPLISTGPGRGDRETLIAAKGTMEALLRMMKEIERHPQVLHLPAPHVWQISPPSTYSNEVAGAAKRDDDISRFGMNGHANGNGHARMLSHSPSFTRLRGGAAGGGGGGVKGGSGKVIVTVELHVGKELEDVECLELTRWAWQRCVSALGQGEEGVTVGIVRG